MKYSQKSAFTLIEFLIAITIVALISVMAFVPY
ncbi:MAG: PulJ/GspJ family protein [Patescibacteria group bacterium]